MWAYPLKTVLELRRREEEEAAADLANATRELRAAEQEEAQRGAAAREARARWEVVARGGDRTDASIRGLAGGHQAGAASVTRVEKADDVSARARFSARLRETWACAEGELDAFRSGPLAARRAAAAAAGKRHVAAAQALQALRMHETALHMAARRDAERGEDDAREEIARAQFHARAAGHRRP